MALSRLEGSPPSYFLQTFLIFCCIKCPRSPCRPVARIGRAPDSKSGCWGFESLLACQFLSAPLFDRQLHEIQRHPQGFLLPPTLSPGRSGAGQSHLPHLPLPAGGHAPRTGCARCPRHCGLHLLAPAVFPGHHLLCHPEAHRHHDQPEPGRGDGRPGGGHPGVAFGAGVVYDRRRPRPQRTPIPDQPGISHRAHRRRPPGAFRGGQARPAHHRPVLRCAHPAGHHVCRAALGFQQLGPLHGTQTFSRVFVRITPPIHVPRRLDPEAFEALRQDVEKQIKELTIQADNWWRSPETIRRYFP